MYCIVWLSWPGNPQELFENDDGTLKNHRIPSRPGGRATSKAAVPPRFTSLFVNFLFVWGIILVQLTSFVQIQNFVLVFFFHFPTWLFPCYTIYLQLPTAIIWSIWQSKRKSEMHFEVLVISQPLSSHSKLCEGLTGSCDFLIYMMYHFDRHVCSRQT